MILEKEVLRAEVISKFETYVDIMLLTKFQALKFT